jgi:F0F1-type ATP synthase membrane subunit b/b'
MDILYLVDRLENFVSSGQRIPLVNQVILKENELLAILDQMRAAIPAELTQAQRIVQDKERILAQAQADAAALLSHAQQEAERTLSQDGLRYSSEERAHEMMRRATEQAQLIVRRAEEQTTQLRREADGYATETLRNLREHLTDIETDLGRTILSIEKGLESLTIQPSDPEEIDEELVAEDIASMAMQETPPSSHVHMPVPAQPRPSSLAVDTMGMGPFY